MPQHLVVTFDPDDEGRAVIAAAIGGTAEITYIAKATPAAREAAIRASTAMMVWNTARELRPEELPLLRGLKLVQLMPAGIDFIPIGDLPEGVPVASNAGAYSEPMAEHAVAMAFAAAKRLLFEHSELAQNRFNQHTQNRMLAGAVCGIYGFGGVGAATARRMRALDMRIHAINRRGATTEAVDWIGTPAQMDTLLAASDVLVLAAPLTRTTMGLIGARELGVMKDDAILINLARGELIDEAAFYQHVKAHPRFTACIDAWWIEPVRHGKFQMDQPFMQLPNVIGSPHNSASVSTTRLIGLQRAAENCRRALMGEPPHNLVGPDDRLL